jgi:hypothetical protein
MHACMQASMHAVASWGQGEGTSSLRTHAAGRFSDCSNIQIDRKLATMTYSSMLVKHERS